MNEKHLNVAFFFESLKVWWWIERVQSELSIWLANKWYNIIHILLDNKSKIYKHAWKKIYMNKKFIYGFGLKKVILLFQCAYVLWKLSKKHNIDTLVWQWDFFYMSVALSKIFFNNSARCIWVVHGTLSIWHRYMRYILLYFLRQLDSIVVISKQEYVDFTEKYNFSMDKVQLIHNGFHADRSNWTKVTFSKQEEDIFWERYVFINIWRLTRQKWHDMLIKGFDNLYKKNPHISLIILGEWEEYDALMKLKNILPSKKHIHLLWNKCNIYDYLNKADCFVMSSRFEWFGLVLLEALSSGLPIISTNCPSWPSEILWWVIWSNTISYNNSIIVVPYNDNTIHHLYTAMEKQISQRFLEVDESYYQGILETFNFNKHISHWQLLLWDL